MPDHKNLSDGPLPSARFLCNRDPSTRSLMLEIGLYKRNFKITRHILIPLIFLLLFLCEALNEGLYVSISIFLYVLWIKYITGNANQINEVSLG